MSARGEYVYFRVVRHPSGLLKGALQIGRNILGVGRRMEQSNFGFLVTEKGICVNGDYGTNPNADEMREFTELMREAVAAYDALIKEQAS